MSSEEMEAEAKAEQPTSPGVSPLQLGESIEELLKAVLQWSINGTLGVDIGLSPQFCSTLLSEGGNDDQSSNPHAPSSTDISEGVPLNPVYKSLASALHQSIISGNFCNTWNQRNEERDDLLLSKGSELVAILKKINFELHVQEPFFSQLKEGLKTVEGRCAVGDYNRIYPGALILFSKCLVMEVVDVHRYISFAKMLETEGLSKVLPGVSTIREGVAIYRQFYTEEKEKLNGVLGLCVSKTASQPYMVLADIIAILGYQGIRSLLGFGMP